MRPRAVEGALKTLYKTYDSRRARAKQRELEARTGLKWDWYQTGNGIRFTPVVTRATEPDEAAARALLPHLDGEYRGFVDLAARSGLKLEQVLAGAKALAQSGRAMAGVNRMGHFALLRALRPWETGGGDQ